MKTIKNFFDKFKSKVRENEDEDGIFSALFEHFITIIITLSALLIASKPNFLFEYFPESVTSNEEQKGIIKFFVVSAVSAIVTIYKVEKTKRRSRKKIKNLKDDQRLKEDLYRKEIKLKEAHYDKLEPKEKVLSPLISLLRSIFIKHANKEEVCDQIITHIEATLANKEFRQPKALANRDMPEMQVYWNQSVKENTEQNEKDKFTEDSVSYGDIKE